MSFTSFVHRLQAALRQSLPGQAAHARLAPSPRREWPAGSDPTRARHAAGLLLVFPIEDQPYLVLTVRAGHLRHGGQVSLPGGVVEPGETVEQAALREAHEEVAIAGPSVQVLGSLTPIDIPVSGFRLHPVLGVSHTRPTLSPADTEVAQILEVPVDALLDPGTLSSAARQRDGRVVQVPFFRVAGYEIWGATAMVLSEFLALVEPLPPFQT